MNQKFLTIGLACIAIVSIAVASIFALNFSINRALTNDAARTGINWSKHIANHIPNVGGREYLRNLGNIEAALRTEQLAHLALDIVKTSELFQIDFINSDCFCSISLGSYLEKYGKKQNEISVRRHHLNPKKDHKHGVFTNRSSSLPKHFSNKIMKHVFTGKAAHKPRHFQGNGLHQINLDWKKAAHVAAIRKPTTFLHGDSEKFSPYHYAEVFYPVEINGEVLYLIRTLVNLDARASSYTLYHYGGFALMLVLLSACFAVPARHHWMAKKQSLMMAERAKFFETYDPLTEVYNRKTMHKLAEQKLLQAKGDKTAWVLTLITLGNLPEINDASGHDFGDSVLLEMSKILESRCNDKSIVSRISGATFAILVPQKLHRHQRKIISASLKRGFTVNVNNRTITLTLNSGTAHYPQHADTFETLLRNAELTLNQARQIGANTHKIFTPELASAHRSRTALKQSFKNAILKKQIIPYYQPIINANTGQLVGLEALARWAHPAKGILSPASFKIVLEDLEISALLGKEMIKLTTKHMGRWKADGIPFGYVGVNINDGDLRRKGFVLETAKALADNGLFGPNLALEVSESCIFGEKKDEFLEKLSLLKSTGCRIALDDFGTGYSSISQLKQVPFDTVKIDRSFIKDINENSNDRAIVKALNDLSHSIKFNLIAEGVETKEQLETTISLGVSRIQGFLFARPMPMADVANFIKTTQRLDPTPKMAS